MPLPTDTRRARRAELSATPAGPGPREILFPAILKRLVRLDLRARRMVEGFLCGLHRAPGRGFSAEFSDYRDFVFGDDPKDIDWRLYARTDRFYVKQFHAETSLRGMFLVDASASMAFGGSERSMAKIEYAVTLAAALALLLQGQHDRVGLMAFGRDVRVCLQPRSTRNHLQRIFRVLSRIETGGRVSLTEALMALGDRTRRRGLVAVFSDAFADLGPLARSLRYLASRRQDLILFHILDRAEMDLPSAEAGWEMALRDPETRRRFPGDAPQLAPLYRERLQRHLAGLRTECAAAGADYHLMVTDEPFDRALWRFLEVRGRRR